MLFSRLSSAGVHGVFVLLFFAVGLRLGSPAEAEVPALPPGSPYSVDGIFGASVVMSEAAAFLFLEVGELSAGDTIVGGF